MIRTHLLLISELIVIAGLLFANSILIEKRRVDFGDPFETIKL